MRFRRSLGVLSLALLAGLVPLAAPPAARAGGLPWFGKEKSKPPVILLAEMIDDVEESLNEMGTVVAKKPDVWGESRLTKHRQEVEEQLAKKIDDFQVLLNASSAVSDQAFLANAIAIQAALGSNPNIPSAESFDPDGDGDKQAVNIISTSNLVSDPTVAPVVDKETGRITNEAVIARTAPGGLRIPVVTKDSKYLGFAQNAISLEPTLQLDQLKRYLDHLNELRRLNEGGDTADAPGYSLNLVRIPVSILPGDETRKGHGAEITVTAEMHLTRELLPVTFRSLVIEDLIDQLALPVVKLSDVVGPLERARMRQLELQSKLSIFNSRLAVLKSEKASVEGMLAIDRIKYDRVDKWASIAKDALTVDDIDLAWVELSEIARDQPSWGTIIVNTIRPEDLSVPSVPKAETEYLETVESIFDNNYQGIQNQHERKEKKSAALRLATKKSNETLQRLSQVDGWSLWDERIYYMHGQGGVIDLIVSEFGLFPSVLPESQIRTIGDQIVSIQAEINNLAETVSVLTQRQVQERVSKLRPGAPWRRSRLPIAPTQITCVFGSRELEELTKLYLFTIDEHCTAASRLSDARGFLKEELHAAYDYLGTPAAIEHWACVPAIAQAVRAGDGATLCELRGQVVRQLICDCPGQGEAPTLRSSTLPLLAWAILVEAALLDQRLNEDLQRVSSDPNCECVFAGPYAFYLPEPPEEARMAFMDYVRCRWPIHVFALDPMTQDQNVAEAFSMRRELQLAAALAFASGSATASETLQFVRRLEIEEQAIALNRTAVAFAHGANTFGWRFRPRFQTMDIESNAVVIGRDLLWGGPSRDARMKDWRMEPGMRECVALVVMPSFVPHVRFDVRSNWFKLTNPDNTEGEMVETVKLSRQIRDMQRLREACSLAFDNYRPGELERLFARVEQLSDKMPLQTLYAQVPYENTTGGFELFSSGVTDLSPELIDFYGAPGIDPASPTTLFLVGKNFSVHQTRLVAGNVEVTDVELLSRDVMKITIPAGVRTVQCCRPVRTPGAMAPGLPPAESCQPCRQTSMTSPASNIGRAIVRVSGEENVSGPSIIGPADPQQSAQETSDTISRKQVAAVAMPASPGESPVAAHPLVEINPTLKVEMKDNFTFEINESTVAPPPAGVPVPAGASSPCLPTAPCFGTSIRQGETPFCQPGEQDYEAVEVHLATPYGVSGRLLIPVIRQAPVNVPPACGLTWSPSPAAVTYSWTGVQMVKDGDEDVPSLSILSILPTADSLVLQAPSGIGLPSPVKMKVHGQMRILDPDTGILGFAPIAFPIESVACDSRGYVLSGGTFQAFHVELANGIKAQLLNLAKQNPVLIENGVKHIQVRVEVEIVTTGGVRPSVAAPLVIDVWLKKP